MDIRGDRDSLRSCTRQERPRKVDVAQHGQLAPRDRLIKLVNRIGNILNVLQVRVDGAPARTVVQDDRLRRLTQGCDDAHGGNAVISQAFQDEPARHILADQRQKAHVVPQHRQRLGHVVTHARDTALNPEERETHRLVVDGKALNLEGRLNVDQARNQDPAHEMTPQTSRVDTAARVHSNAPAAEVTKRADRRAAFATDQARNPIASRTYCMLKELSHHLRPAFMQPSSECATLRPTVRHGSCRLRAIFALRSGNQHRRTGVNGAFVKSQQTGDNTWTSH